MLSLSLSLSLFISLIQCATLLNAIGKQRKHLIILYYTQNQLCFSTHSPQPVHIYLHTTLLFVLCLKSTMHDNVPIKHILSQFCTIQDLYDSLRVFNQPQAYGILCINYTYIISIIIYYFLIIFAPLVEGICNLPEFPKKITKSHLWESATMYEENIPHLLCFCFILSKQFNELRLVLSY